MQQMCKVSALQPEQKQRLCRTFRYTLLLSARHALLHVTCCGYGRLEGVPEAGGPAIQLRQGPQQSAQAPGVKLWKAVQDCRGNRKLLHCRAPMGRSCGANQHHFDLVCPVALRPTGHSLHEVQSCAVIVRTVSLFVY